MRIKKQDSRQIVLIDTLSERYRLIGFFFIGITLLGWFLVVSIGIVGTIIPVIIVVSFAGWLTSETITIDTSTDTLNRRRRGFFFRYSSSDIPLSAVQYVAVSREPGVLSRSDNLDDLQRSLSIFRFWGNYSNIADKWVVSLKINNETLIIDKSTHQSSINDKAMNIANHMGKRLVNMTDNSNKQAQELSL